MTSLPIKWRIALGIIILMITAICTLSLVAYLELKETLIRDADSRLSGDAETIIAILTSEDSVEEARKEIQTFLNPNIGSERTLYRIWLDHAENVFSGGNLFDEKWAEQLSLSQPLEKSEDPLYWTVQMNHEMYRALRISFADSTTDTLIGQPINILICHPMAHVADQLAIFLKVMTAVGLLLIVFAVTLTVLTIEWGLRPITSLTHRMDQISGKHLQGPAPLLVKGVPELQSFVNAWNRMLERLALSMQQQRRFTADASHELRTPLTIVKSTLQCARTRKRSVNSYETSIDQSLEDLGRLEALIEQLLILARLDDISDQCEHTPVDVGEIVEEVCEQYNEFVNPNRSILRWTTCHAMVLGSYDQLKRLISNLLDNAIKFGPTGGTITGCVQCLGQTVRVQIHDEGGGISPDDQKRIFDRFYRIRTNSPKAAPGSGLGLALAQEVVTKHGGTINVESGPEIGTDFVIVLPLLTPPSEARSSTK